MPAYITNPDSPRSLLTPGVPGYSAGSFASGTQPMKANITQAAVATNVVTATIRISAGNIPTAGQLVRVTGANNSGINVTGVALTSASITASTGIGTIVYPATTADFATTAMGGNVTIVPIEVGDTLASNTKYLQFAVAEPIGHNTNQKTVTWSTVVSGAPAASAVNLEASIVDIDAQYQQLDSSNSTTGETRLYQGLNFPFYRITTTTITGGTAPTLIAKILV